MNVGAGFELNEVPPTKYRRSPSRTALCEANDGKGLLNIRNRKNIFLQEQRAVFM